MESLIERLGEQNKFIRWYRQYACKVNGMPVEPEGAPSVIVEHEHTHTHEGQPPAAVPSQPQQQNSALPSWAKTAVVAGLSALGGGSLLGGAGIVLDWWNSKSEVVQPSESQPASGSLLQDLEDRGFHLPSNG